MLESRILFSAFFVGGVVLAIGYEDSRPGFMIAYGLFALFLLALSSALLSPRCLKIEEELSAEVIFKDEEIIYTLRIINRSPFFYSRANYHFFNPDFDHFVGQELPPAALLPGNRNTWQYQMRFPYRGEYRVGVELVTVTDIFGLFNFTVKNKSPVSLVVFPKANDGFTHELSSEAQSEMRRKNLFEEDYSVIADVSRYTSDDMRRIHWKLSAKRVEFMVKLFDTFEQEKNILFLDARKTPLAAGQALEFEDKVISYLTAAADFFAGSASPTSIFSGGEDTPVNRGEEFAFYTRLACFRFDDKDGGAPSLLKLEDCRLYAFITAIDKSLMDALCYRVSVDRNVFVYYFYSSELPLSGDTDKLLGDLEAHGAKVCKINLTGDGEL